MKCSECSEDAVIGVRTNNILSAVCEHHRVAIVRRIEQATNRLGRSGNPNLQSILIKAIDNISFEDLAIELPASTVL